MFHCVSRHRSGLKMTSSINCAFAQENRGGFDDIAFFQASAYALTLEVLETCNKLLAKRYGSSGIGIQARNNLLSTMGHHEEDILHTLHDGFTTSLTSTEYRTALLP